MDTSNQRKGSAPPVMSGLNSGNNVSGIPTRDPTSAKSPADIVKNVISDKMYQERVNRLTAKTDKLINSHKKAQQV